MGKLDSLSFHGYEYDENFVEGLSIQWHLTTACDLRCKHCYAVNNDDNMELLANKGAKMAFADY